MQINPLVSIIIPIYNGANYLTSAIDSALVQDYRYIEVIVINDGSTDETDIIAQSYGDKIRYFRKENGGVATALNLALEKAHGDYISWLSHDDFYAPNKIQMQIDKLALNPSNKKLIPYSDVQHLHVEENEQTNFLIPQSMANTSRINSLKVLYTSKLHGCSLLIPRQAFVECGNFNPALKTTQDYDLWFKFINRGYCFIHIPQILVYSRLHRQQDTKTKQDLYMKERQILFLMADNMFSSEIQTLPEIDQLPFFWNGASTPVLTYKTPCFIRLLSCLLPKKSWRKKFRNIKYQSSSKT